MTASPESNANFSDESRSYQLTENLAKDLSLSEEQLVRANVVKTLPDEPGKLIVSIRGKRVVAKSELDVRANQTLLVRVKNLAHPIELSLIDPYEATDQLTDSDLETFLEVRDLPSKESDVDLLRDWLEESFPLDEQLLESALQRSELLRDQDDKLDDGQVWALSFLTTEDFPLNDELVDLLGSARNSDFQDDMTIYFRSRDPNFFGRTESTVMESIQSVGFDLIRQFAKHPHTASKTLHAQLLQNLMQQNTSKNSISYRLLGFILGLALTNLRDQKGFTVAFPFAETGRIKLFWMDGSVSGPLDWYVNCEVKFEKLGSISARIESTENTLDVLIRASDPGSVRLLRGKIDQLKSKLKTGYEDVKVKVDDRSSDSFVDPFSHETATNDQTRVSFSLGLDVTA